MSEKKNTPAETFLVRTETRLLQRYLLSEQRQDSCRDISCQNRDKTPAETSLVRTETRLLQRHLLSEQRQDSNRIRMQKAEVETSVDIRQIINAEASIVRTEKKQTKLEFSPIPPRGRTCLRELRPTSPALYLLLHLWFSRVQGIRPPVLCTLPSQWLETRSS